MACGIFLIYDTHNPSKIGTYSQIMIYFLWASLGSILMSSAIIKKGKSIHTHKKTGMGYIFEDEYI